MVPYTLSDLKYIRVPTLYTWLKNQGPGKFMVVDVRDSDYIGGHIKGSMHYPSSNFEETLADLKKQLIANQVEDVIFHCALSQVRGPKSTLKFLRSLSQVRNDKEIEFFNQLNVWVLKGGFTEWQRHYGEDETVTEGYDKALWEL